VFARADWRPEALVVVGSGGELHGVVPRLEDILAVPVFVPAESELALARGAALASAHNTEFMQIGRAAERAPRGGRRSLATTGPLAMLVAGAVTFVASVSVAVSLEVTPERDVAAPEPQAAAKASPDVESAAVRAALPADPSVALPAPIAESPLPPPEAPPTDVAPPEAVPVDIPEALPVGAVPPEAPVDASVPQAPVVPPPIAPIEPLPPGAAPPAPGLVPAQPTPVQRRPGLLSRIRDRLSNIGQNDEAPAVQQAPVPAAPPAPGAPLPEAAAPPPSAPVPPPEAPPLLPPQ
jgi:hypothetical protein